MSRRTTIGSDGELSSRRTSIMSDGMMADGTASVKKTSLADKYNSNKGGYVRALQSGKAVEKDGKKIVIDPATGLEYLYTGMPKMTSAKTRSGISQIEKQFGSSSNNSSGSTNKTQEASKTEKEKQISMAKEEYAMRKKGSDMKSDRIEKEKSIPPNANKVNEAYAEYVENKEKTSPFLPSTNNKIDNAQKDLFIKNKLEAYKKSLSVRNVPFTEKISKKATESFEKEWEGMQNVEMKKVDNLTNNVNVGLRQKDNMSELRSMIRSSSKMPR